MIRLFPLQLLEGTTLAKQTQTKYKNSFIFSPIFPREVIETKWMTKEQIYYIRIIAKKLEQKYSECSNNLKQCRKNKTQKTIILENKPPKK